MELRGINCPYCGDSIHVDVSEYMSKSGLVIDGEFHFSCKKNPLEDDCHRDYEENTVINNDIYNHLKNNKISFN